MILCYIKLKELWTPREITIINNIILELESNRQTGHENYILKQDSLINADDNLTFKESISIDETSFNNITAKAKEEGFNLSWGINYDVYDAFLDKNLIIKYNTNTM